MSNTFGTLFKVTTFGESHGPYIGCVIDGCPPGIPLELSDIQRELDRRRPGQSSITTDRNESDKVNIISGLYEGKTTGTPITCFIENTDANKGDYASLKNKFRPSHADYTTFMKYGIRYVEGGGRSSARETAARVAAGAIAQKILKLWYNIRITAFVQSIYNIGIEWPNPSQLTQEHIDSNPVRCPDPKAAEKMVHFIEKLKSEGDSIGGIIGCHISNTPAGWGDPVFDKLEANLAKAMLSIPATKGFEVGSGFWGSENLKGSEHNDPFISSEENDLKKITTKTNYSGGIQGGISNGMPIEFRVAFKPTSTIRKSQETVDIHGKSTTIEVAGRHDPCVLPRAVPIIESMAALVLIDHCLRHRAQCAPQPTC